MGNFQSLHPIFVEYFCIFAKKDVDLVNILVIEKSRNSWAIFPCRACSVDPE
jgi:hypothetical protein